jgi:hypothetical protein
MPRQSRGGTLWALAAEKLGYTEANVARFLRITTR